MKNSLLVLLVALSIGVGVQAADTEFRLWTGLGGESVEAEFVRFQGDKVVLHKKDGTEVRVSMDSLSVEDQRYAMLLSPPRIEIKVSDKTEKSNIAYVGSRRNGSQVRNETVNIAVDLHKKSIEPYTLKMKLEVVLVGKVAAMDRYAILLKDESDFEFKDENKGIYRYSCKPVDLRQVTGSRQAGRDYEGWLAAVRDEEGRVIAMKGSRAEFENNAETILTARRGAVYDRQFNLISDGKSLKAAANAP